MILVQRTVRLSSTRPGPAGLEWCGAEAAVTVSKSVRDGPSRENDVQSLSRAAQPGSGFTESSDLDRLGEATVLKARRRPPGPAGHHRGGPRPQPGPGPARPPARGILNFNRHRMIIISRSAMIMIIRPGCQCFQVFSQFTVTEST